MLSLLGVLFLPLSFLFFCSLLKQVLVSAMSRRPKQRCCMARLFSAWGCLYISLFSHLFSSFFSFRTHSLERKGKDSKEKYGGWVACCCAVCQLFRAALNGWDGNGLDAMQCNGLDWKCYGMGWEGNTSGSASMHNITYPDDLNIPAM